MPDATTWASESYVTRSKRMRSFPKIYLLASLALAAAVFIGSNGPRTAAAQNTGSKTPATEPATGTSTSATGSTETATPLNLEYQFAPSEQIGADRAVAFPADI